MSHPNVTVSVHCLIYDLLLKCFRVLGNIEDAVDVAFEVAVVLVDHGVAYLVGRKRSVNR